MKPGPKPMPSAIRKLRGAKTTNDHEPRPSTPISPGNPPAHLDAYARDKWLELSDELASQNLLTSWDFDAFAIYCEAYSRWRLACERLKDADNYLAANQQISAWVTILNQSRRDMLRFGSLFGLNPSDRARLNVQAAAFGGIPDAAFDFGYMPDGSEIPKCAWDAHSKKMAEERKQSHAGPDPMIELQRRAIADFDAKEKKKERSAAATGAA